MELLDYLAARIKELRLSYNSGEGLSQDTLAKHLKVAPNTISRWETGTYCPSVTDLERIARFFGVTMMAFMPPEMIDTPKKREMRSRSLTLGRYVPVSHLEIVLGATFK